MNYPIVIHKDKSSDYGVIVPDLPGCFSAGSTTDEALAMAKEAIELHLEGLIEEGLPVPPPGRMEDHKDKPEYRGGVWAVISVDPSTLRLKAKRINVSIPERVLDAIDRTARAERQTRSAFLVKAATAYISRPATAAKLSKRGQRRSGR